MNKRIQQLAEQARIKDHWSIDEGRYLTNYLDEQKFAELIVQDCANFVRKDYDRNAAETIAWRMEIEYGLHGDYA